MNIEDFLKFSSIILTGIMLIGYIIFLFTAKEEVKTMESLDILGIFIAIILLGLLFSGILFFTTILGFIFIGIPVLLINLIRGKGFKF
jgi:hypothetical protein